MAPRLDPNLPIVWRTPYKLQLGSFTPVCVLDNPGRAECELLELLQVGASTATLFALGRSRGASDAEIAHLVGQVTPAFDRQWQEDAVTAAQALAATHDESTNGTGATHRAHSTGDLGCAHRPRSVSNADGTNATDVTSTPPLVLLDSTEPTLAAGLLPFLTGLGIRARGIPGERDSIPPHHEHGTGHPVLVVIVSPWAIAPARHRRWVRQDQAHLAIVTDERGIRIGPLVEPGRGPCLRCLDLAQCARDPAWPAIASQLSGRPGPRHPARIRHDALAFAAAVIDDFVTTERRPLRACAVRFTGGGGHPNAVSEAPPRNANVMRNPERVLRHSDCGCHSLAEIATAHEGYDDLRPAPSSGSGDASRG